MREFLSCVILLMFGRSVYSYSSGAPSAACSSLTPGHGGSSQSSPPPSTLNLSVFNLYDDNNFYYEPGNVYQLTLGGDTFKGFLLLARKVADDTTLVGSFSDPIPGTRLSSCSPSNGGITHSDSSDKTSITGTWTAPPRGTGPIRFRYAVVQVFSTYWADIMSSVIYESGVHMLFDGGILANNSLVHRTDIGEDEEGITCISENADCCSNTNASIGWFSPSGTPVYEGADGASTLYVTRGAGFVRLNRITGGTSALYWCDVPDYSGTLERFYAGLYIDSIISGVFSNLGITFEFDEADVTVDPPEFALVCRSRGGPVTTVVWERDSVTIQDDSNHSSSQIVVNASLAIYHNVLVVRGRYGGEYECTVFNARTHFSTTLVVEVGTDPTNLVAIQQDLSAMSINVTWSLPSSPTPTGIGFLVFYQTAESSNSINVELCTECEIIISELMRGSTYSISVVTLSDHLPSNLVGPANVTLAMGCVELGYTEGCCVPGTDNTCALDLPGTGDDCFCDVQCYSLENCCHDILLSCTPPVDANLCMLFRGYDCHLNAQCLSVNGQVNDSASYQCVCNDGYIGDGNTTCLGASVEVNPSAILVSNGSTGLNVTCVAPSFIDSGYYWILVDDNLNTTVATGGVFELPQLLFSSAVQGARYQCIVETPYGDIFSDIVQVIVSPEGGVSVEPPITTADRGQTLTLVCSSQGGPGNTFKWTQLSTGIQVSSEDSLTIHVSSGDDGGVYRCSVENDAGSDTADATIIVPPEFDMSPTSITTQIGNNVTLQCTVNAFPTPSIEWVHFTTIVRETGRIEIDDELVNSTVTSTLSISDIHTEDYGRYTCRTNGTLDSEPATVTGPVSVDECDIVYNLTQTLANLSVGDTQTVCFQCLYGGSVGVGTEWTLDNETISDSIGTVVDEVLAIYVASEVFSVHSSLLLQCTETSTYTYSITIRVLEAPVVPNSIDVEENYDVFITCDSSGSIPVISHTWRDTSGTIISTSEDLTLLDISTAQDGVYTCTIEDDMGGTASANTTINVLSIPRVLDFTLSPHLVLIGERLQLFCAYSGAPAPSIDWLVNGSADPDFNVTSNATYSVLTVETVADTDDGIYTCSVSNSIGSDQASITVNVLLTPPPPVIYITATGTSLAGQPYTLTCLAVLLEGSSDTADVQWLGPAGAVIVNDGGIMISDLMINSGVMFSKILTFATLLGSQAGEYTCQAGFPDPDGSSSDIVSNQTTIVTVQIPTPSLSITLPLQPIYEGTSIEITCIAAIDDAIDTDTRARFNWTYEGSSDFPESRFNFSETAQMSILELNPITLQDSGEYSCSVVFESLTQHVEVTDVVVNELLPPSVEVLKSGDVDAGGVLSLICSVTTVENLVSPPQVKFLDALNKPPLQQQLQIGSPITEGAVTNLTMVFSPLVTSAAGKYTCRATIDIPLAAIGNISSEASIEITVIIPPPSVRVTPGNESVVPYAAIEYSLLCYIDLNTTYVDTETEALVVWINSDGQVVGNNSRITVSETLAVDGDYKSTLTFSPLSLTDTVFVCSVIISPDNTSSFVSSSSNVTDTYIISAIAPPTPNVTFMAIGSGVAGETMQLLCISEFEQGLFRPPTIVVVDGDGVQQEVHFTMLMEGRAEGRVVLAPLLTSHSGVYNCVSSYDFPEVGLADMDRYSTRQTITVTVSIPLPQLTFTTEPNDTYIGTQTQLNCIVELSATVDSAIQVYVSWTRNNSSNSHIVEEGAMVTALGHNTFQSTIVFSPLVKQDEDEYMCSVTVESNITHVTGAAVEGLYSLTPLALVEPLVVIASQQPTTLGTSVTLICTVTVVEGLLYDPTIEWVQAPGTVTIENDTVISDRNVYWRMIELNPLLATHGGLYVCSARLVFPDIPLPTLLNTQNYSLIVKAPVPNVVITQDPIGSLIEGSPVSLTCTALIPSPNDITFAVSIKWADAEMSEFEGSMDGRIEITATMEQQPNVYTSMLTIPSIDAELDSMYSCIAEVILSEEGEFVITEPGTKTTSLVILGPPADFEVTSKTQTSLSFAWGLPLTPAPVIEYILQCRAVVAGIEDPAPLNTTDQSALLLSLSPGVSYTCSLTALTDTNMPPPITIITTTLESVPTGPPLNFMAVSAGARSITFTWEAPQPHLQNGAILSYTILCMPTFNRQLSPVTKPGSVTWTGFSPLTLYNCSISASNSVGSGPPAHNTVTTGDDTTPFQLKLLGIQDCVLWTNQDKDVKTTDVISAIVDNINQRCDCSFTEHNVLNGVFQCFGTNADSVTFRAGLLGLTDTNSSTLVTYIAEWVGTGQTVLLQNVHYDLDSNCRDEVVIEDLSDPECMQVGSESSSSFTLNAVAAAGITAAAILVVVVLACATIVVVVFVRRHHISSAKLQSKSSQEMDYAKLVHISISSNRDSLGSNDMAFNEQYRTSSFTTSTESVASNPMYENPSTGLHEVGRSIHGAPLPPLPEEPGEYALPSTGFANSSNNPRPPTAYLQPMTPPTSSLAPFDSSIVFSNRASGIYEEIKPASNEAHDDKKPEGSESSVIVGEYELPSPKKIVP